MISQNYYGPSFWLIAPHPSKALTDRDNILLSTSQHSGREIPVEERMSAFQSTLILQRKDLSLFI